MICIKLLLIKLCKLTEETSPEFCNISAIWRLVTFPGPARPPSPLPVQRDAVNPCLPPLNEACYPAVQALHSSLRTLRCMRCTPVQIKKILRNFKRTKKRTKKVKKNYRLFGLFMQIPSLRVKIIQQCKMSKYLEKNSSEICKT